VPARLPCRPPRTSLDGLDSLRTRPSTACSPCARHDGMLRIFLLSVHTPCTQELHYSWVGARVGLCFFHSSPIACWLPRLVSPLSLSTSALISIYQRAHPHTTLLSAVASFNTVFAPSESPPHHPISIPRLIFYLFYSDFSSLSILAVSFVFISFSCSFPMLRHSFFFLYIQVCQTSSQHCAAYKPTDTSPL
jgi:hypothetical protein